MPTAIADAWSKPARFVIGLDIGTTHSSVTYAHLQPNLKPFNDRVTHWPSRVGLGGSGDAKTASMLYYDTDNRMKAVGAAVATPAMRHAASKNGWNLVRYFKLHMHPPGMVQIQKFNNIEGLPQGLTVEKAYANMISYMLNHTRNFFNERNSTIQWHQLVPIMTLVIAHPNGWGLQERDRLRRAVVLSGAMNETDALRHVCFVPEAEAAVHYVLWEKSQEPQPGDDFIVCDAGGSTVDTTTYRVLHEFETTPELEVNIPAKKGNKMMQMFRRVSSGEPSEHNQRKPAVLPQTPTKKPAIRLKELKASDCQPAGGVLVNENFVAWLRGQFSALPPNHGYNLDLCVQRAEESFEASCKREFRTSLDAPSEYIVEMSTEIQELGYAHGNIVLQPDTVRGFFDDAVRLILQSIHKQIAGTKAKYVFLVGGFGASQYLRQRVIDEFQRDNCQIIFLDDAHGKAASDGSIIWFVRQGVSARAARTSFGLDIAEPYHPSMDDQGVRQQLIFPNGRRYVKGRWDLIIEKDFVMDERSAIRRDYSRTYNTSDPDLGQFTVELYAWTGDSEIAPAWVTDPRGDIVDGFSVICEITADLSGLQGSLKKQSGNMSTYYRLDFHLCLEFGGVELKAYLEWNEKNMTRRSEAKIIAAYSLPHSPDVIS